MKQNDTLIAHHRDAHHSPTTSPDHVPVYLPSGFEPYQFKALRIRTVNAKAQMRFSYAHGQDTTRDMLTVVDSLIDQSPGENIAFQLTPEDFGFVCYWLYTNSYLPRPFVTLQICTNPDHLRRAEKKEIDHKTLANELEIPPDKVTVEVRHFDPEQYESFVPHGYVTAQTVKWPTMEDTCFFEEAYREIDAHIAAYGEGNEGNHVHDKGAGALSPLLQNFLPASFGGSNDALPLDEFVNLLCLLKVPDDVHGDPWEWRMHWFESASIEEAAALHSWSRVVFGANINGVNSGYGVRLTTSFVCKECGARNLVHPKILARNYF